MGKKKKRQRRQQHGSAWHWKQTDCWYYTRPGTRKRVPLFDEDGNRIRGKENKEKAQLALARIRIAQQDGEPQIPQTDDQWTVARVCSLYIDQCKNAYENGTGSFGQFDSANRYLNDLCGYCGAMRVAELKKGHIKNWVESHGTWRSPATQRNVLGLVLAAFNYADRMYEVPNSSSDLVGRWRESAMAFGRLGSLPGWGMSGECWPVRVRLG